MLMKKKQNIIPVKLLDKTVKELYNDAKMSMPKISSLLGLTIAEVKSFLPEGSEEYPVCHQPHKELVDKILYDAEYPVAREVIVKTEKERFEKYAEIEFKCLEVMYSLLDYYQEQSVGLDPKLDQFKARLANDFIKATHNVRQELIQKYAIDSGLSNESLSAIKVDWIVNPITKEEE